MYSRRDRLDIDGYDRVTVPVRIMERLSEHDKAVLDVIFDPLQLMGSNSSTISQEESFSEDDSHSLNFELDTQVAEIVKRAIKASDDGRFDEALEFFEAAIKKAPESPGVLNDRAQVLRLMGRNDGKRILNSI